MMRVSGRLRVPGDKSISHRALMFAALGDGPSTVRDILDSADVRSTAGLLRALGVQVPEVRAEMIIPGVGLRGLRGPSGALDCGNSGTTARLMAGVVAGVPIRATFIGDASLSRRPMRRVARPLESMGARVELPPHGGLPMTVQGGGLRALAWNSEAASAQIKSAILLAGLVGGVRVEVREPAPSRDHTERMLIGRGVAVNASPGHAAMEPPDRLMACDTQVPGDPSSAAFFAALAALADAGEVRLEQVCVNPTRTGFLETLAAMGAIVEREDERLTGGEQIATVVVRPGALRGVRIDGDQVPAMIDELPLVACLATRAEGETVIAGAEELRVKESDRIAAVVSALRAVGAEAEELPDGMRIVGDRRPLRGRVETHGDHRLAMSFGILGALPGNEIVVDDPDCVAVSYPRFWTDLAAIVS